MVYTSVGGFLLTRRRQRPPKFLRKPRTNPGRSVGRFCTRVSWSLLYMYGCGGGGGYCQRNCPRYANGSGCKAWGAVGGWALKLVAAGVVWWSTTSAGWTLLLCSSRFLNLLRTRRIAIIVPLLPTILSLGLRVEKLKIAILRPLGSWTRSDWWTESKHRHDRAESAPIRTFFVAVRATDHSTVAS